MNKPDINESLKITESANKIISIDVINGDEFLENEHIEGSRVISIHKNIKSKVLKRRSMSNIEIDRDEKGDE